MRGGLTEQIAHFSAHASALDLDDEICNIVKTGFVDIAGTMLAGSREPVVDVLRRYVASHGDERRQASLLFGETLLSVRDAALINATAGHALDYDDVALCSHPSTVLVPALLAEGQWSSTDGASLIRAYVVGYETWAELLARDEDSHHLKGWHPTAVFGVVAAAAAVAALRGLTTTQCRHAIGIAASMAGGVVANFGSMVKPLHAGHAAAHAIDSVDLAWCGMEASEDVIEHHAGYLAALSPHGRARREASDDELGRTLRIRELRLNIKKYPMCFATHRIIDAALALVREHDVRPHQIRSMHAQIGVAQASMLRNHKPVSAVQAKFSLEFALAAAFTVRGIGLAELRDDFVMRPDVRELFEKVRIETRDSKCPYEPALAESDRLVVELHDGRSLDSGEVQFALGAARNPMTLQELRVKFFDCAEVAPEINATRLFDRLSTLETLGNVEMWAPSGIESGALA